MLKASRFLNPKADVVFKRIFGEHKNLLKSFLNALMPLNPDQYIEDLVYLTPEQVPVIPNFKRTIVDVRCIDNQGRQFIVEMQMEWTASFAARVLYGASQAYVGQLPKGGMYEDLCPVYALGLLNENFDSSDEWYHRYRLTHETQSHKHIDGIEIVLLELMKFRPTTRAEKHLSALWIRFLNDAETWVDIPEEFKPYPELIEALELTQEAAFNPAQLEYYRTYWDSVSCEKSLISGYFNKGIKEGRAEGHAEGLAEGHAAGLREGIEKGRDDFLKAMVQRLRAQGMSLEEISTMLNVQLQDIKRLIL